MTEPLDSVQKIWQDQPVEGIKMPAEVIRKRASRFERKVKWRNIREYAASLVTVVLLGYFAATTHDLLSRVSFGLFIAALAWIVVQLHRKGAPKRMPSGVDTLTALRLYRSELERQRALVKSVRSWYLAPLVPGLVVYAVGQASHASTPATWIRLVFLVGFVAAAFRFVWKLNLRAAECLERMIDELNASE